MILKLPAQLDKYDFYVKKYREHEGNIKIQKIYKPRTIRQNAYMHVLITLFGIETGYTLSEAKTVLKRKCQFMRYEKNGEVFLRSTTDLDDTKKMSEFIDWIRNFAGQNGIYLPTSEDYYRNWAEIEQTIEQNKAYL